MQWFQAQVASGDMNLLFQPGWLELYDLSLHSNVEARTPLGPYIHGMVDLVNRRFEPDKLTISGEPMKKSSEISGTPGWVELRTVQFHGDMEAVRLIPPYVQGLMDEKNHFYPDEPFAVIGE